MNHTITDHRIVPTNSASINFHTGRVVTTPNNNAGKHAVCVKLIDGRTAWGFGDCAAKAEAEAITMAKGI